MTTVGRMPAAVSLHASVENVMTNYTEAERDNFVVVCFARRCYAMFEMLRDGTRY